MQRPFCVVNLQQKSMSRISEMKRAELQDNFLKSIPQWDWSNLLAQMRLI
jgi:hypothetical protein